MGTGGRDDVSVQWAKLPSPLILCLSRVMVFCSFVQQYSSKISYIYPPETFFVFLFYHKNHHYQSSLFYLYLFSFFLYFFFLLTNLIINKIMINPEITTKIIIFSSSATAISLPANKSAEYFSPSIL